MTEFERLATIEPQPTLTHDFRKLAEYLFKNWYIESIDSKFEIFEAEFLLQTKSEVHNDPNIDASDLQCQFGNWYIPNGGIDITFGCENYAASIFLRALKDMNTGEMIIGPQRCFESLFRNGGKVIDPNPPARLLKTGHLQEVELWNVPRVNLPIGENSADQARQLKYLFRPYRFVRTDMEDFPDKYMAMLYFEKIKKEELRIKREEKIYQKYLDAYDTGYYADKLDTGWRISSRSLRLAALLGFVHHYHKEHVL